MARRTLGPRGLRRLRARAEAGLHHDIDRLTALAEGGRTDRPIEVESPTQVDVRAAAMLCPHCETAPRLLEHRAVKIGEERLRMALLRCASCGRDRSVYFRIAPPALN